MGDFDDIAQAALELGLTDVAETLKNTVRPTKEAIKEAATKFCNQYRIVESLYMQEVKSNPEKYNDSSKGQKRRDNLRSQIQLEHVREAFEEFQKLINLYFNQVMLLMYVYIDPKMGRVQLAVTEEKVEHLKRTSYGGVEYYLENIQDLLFELGDYDSTALDAAESSIYARWNIARQRHKKKNKLPILWYLGQWEGAWVNNLGTIAEAYVNFYLSKYQFTRVLEQDVKTYITNSSYGAMAVDNASGFLIGDVSYKGLHFAVKKQSASPMRLSTVYDEVNNILSDPSFDLENLKDIFITQERKKAQNNQAGLLSENIERTYSNLIEDYLNNNKILS